MMILCTFSIDKIMHLCYMCFCKRGNIRGALISRKIQQARIQNFGHVGVV